MVFRMEYAAICRDLPRFAAICRDLPRFAAICRDSPHDFIIKVLWSDLIVFRMEYAAICRDLPRFAAIHLAILSPKSDLIISYNIYIYI